MADEAPELHDAASRDAAERSLEMMTAAYYLARCGEARSDGPSGPPARLAARSWRAAYDLFFEALSDGRELRRFRNSLKNARDAYDVLFDNGRVGWVAKEGEPATLGPRLLRVHEEWRDRSDEELERFVFRLLTGETPDETASPPGIEARTEGGLRVIASRRRERSPELRRAAIEIHGTKCMACGFDFEAVYGEFGAGFVEVHHAAPLAAGLRETDPEKDLVVLCANCHRMVHRTPGVCLSLDELRSRMRRR